MHKILIVDDERPARDYITELVTFYIPDSKVTQADNALNALNHLRADNYDLLFLDIDFGAGKMTGLELLEEINRMGKPLYTVIISAHYKFDYAIKGMELGAARYIPKPLDKNAPDTNTMQCITKPLYKEKIQEAIQLYLNKIKVNYIDLKMPDGVRRVPLNRLLAIETAGRGRLKVYTTDALLSDVAFSLNQLHERLPSNFCCINRNCMVNVHAVKHYNLKLCSREVFIICQDRKYSFTVSRHNMKEFFARFDPDNPEKHEQ
ncbi:MAG: LytTR family DNA-binding domain-containing protein [Candidatus Azobacteroides sp.]|nr:LytTR family DNA-binding domain-containing protein [Candidatus Azobacteroides sp.]